MKINTAAFEPAQERIAVLGRLTGSAGAEVGEGGGELELACLACEPGTTLSSKMDPFSADDIELAEVLSALMNHSDLLHRHDDDYRPKAIGKRALGLITTYNISGNIKDHPQIKKVRTGKTSPIIAVDLLIGGLIHPGIIQQSENARAPLQARSVGRLTISCLLCASDATRHIMEEVHPSHTDFVQALMPTIQHSYDMHEGITVASALPIDGQALLE